MCTNPDFYDRNRTRWRCKHGIDCDRFKPRPAQHTLSRGGGHGPPAEAVAARLLPERFSLLTVPADQMPALYHRHSFSLYLSKEESFGNAEAMVCGLPVAALDTPRALDH